ncbi:hypothetical protein [Brevundimonas sp. SL130]|uniref:hypothetical protein n=1 Tax=Brevundimonas sp. SL130 TaxID=2995143 RepID=UPI00226CBF5A|nr:hypothetical protein [Brevundimonas sp. SL130]WAC59875.1 hypothetical protein OU998_00060 [Brevundimonas sp. SL130]
MPHYQLVSSVHALPPAQKYSSSFAWVHLLFLFGLICASLQFVQIGPAKPIQIWLICAISALAFSKKISVSLSEAYAFAIFFLVSSAATFFQDFGRIKETDQLVKFLFIYPGFYVVGKSLGKIYYNKNLPYGFLFLFIFLGIQFVIQQVQPPIIYQTLSFGQGALHGTFRERNWISVFFFGFSYILWIKNKSTSNTALFIALTISVTLLSGSKSMMVAAGIAFLAHAKLPVWARSAVIIVGIMLYIYLFSDSLSGDKLEVRLKTERGLAYEQSILLISDNILGYGFGFVEYHFSNISTIIRGLGLGTNSVFSSPIDLMIIAGFTGLAFWMVFFLGIGLGSTKWVAPVAAWSVINPLHQSETVYLLLGILTALSLAERNQAKRAKAKKMSLRRPIAPISGQTKNDNHT